MSEHATIRDALGDNKVREASRLDGMVDALNRRNSSAIEISNRLNKLLDRLRGVQPPQEVAASDKAVPGRDSKLDEVDAELTDLEVILQGIFSQVGDLEALL